MRWGKSSNGLHRLARWLVTPQLMRRAVRQLAQVLLLSTLLACGDTGADGPVRSVVVGVQTVISTESELLAHPTDLTVDSRGRLYVLDGQNSQVVVLDSAGSMERQFGRPGAGPGELNRPAAIAVQGDTVVVLDSGNGRIQRWRTSGEFVGVQQLEGFTGSGPAALHPSGWLAASTLGVGNVLVTILDAFGKPHGGLRAPVVPPLAMIDIAEMKRQITNGEVPAFFRNMVTPVWHNESEIWVLLQTEGLVERYSIGGDLETTTQLQLPEAELIRADFFTRNQQAAGFGLVPLAYAADAEVVMETLWILLNLPEDHPAVIVLIDDAGAVTRIMEFSDVNGARSFAVGPGGRRVYFGMPTEASVLVTNVE